MILSVTGHRPNKFFHYGYDGYEWYSPIRVWIREQLAQHLKHLSPEYTITGMAVGVDQDFAYVCCELGIPFVAAIPCEGQESQWPEDSKRFYRELLERAWHKIIVTPGGYAAWKMQKRNEWMVDNCHAVIAVWDGTSGGTANCVAYATKIQKPIYRIDPSSLAGNR